MDCSPPDLRGFDGGDGEIPEQIFLDGYRPFANHADPGSFTTDFHIPPYPPQYQSHDNSFTPDHYAGNLPIANIRNTDTFDIRSFQNHAFNSRYALADGLSALESQNVTIARSLSLVCPFQNILNGCANIYQASSYTIPVARRDQGGKGRKFPPFREIPMSMVLPRIQLFEVLQSSKWFETTPNVGPQPTSLPVWMLPEWEERKHFLSPWQSEGTPEKLTWTLSLFSLTMWKATLWWKEYQVQLAVLREKLSWSALSPKPRVSKWHRFRSWNRDNPSRQY